MDVIDIGTDGVSDPKVTGNHSGVHTAKHPDTNAFTFISNLKFVGIVGSVQSI